MGSFTVVDGGRNVPGREQRSAIGLGIQLLEKKTGKFTIVCMWVCGVQGGERCAQPDERKSQIASWPGCKNKTQYGCNTLVQSVLFAQPCKRLKEITGAVPLSV